jgi:hypothetical protein
MNEPYEDRIKTIARMLDDTLEQAAGKNVPCAGESLGIKLPADECTIFDVDAMNRDHALLLMGSRAVVVRKKSDGPITDRVRFLAPEAFRLLFANRFEGKVTWANAWLSHPRRQAYAGVEFFPDPDGAKSTPGCLDGLRRVSEPFAWCV